MCLRGGVGEEVGEACRASVFSTKAAITCIVKGMHTLMMFIYAQLLVRGKVPEHCTKRFAVQKIHC